MSLIQYLSRIQFDFDAIDLLADEISALGLRRPFLVTDRGIEASGILGRALHAAHPHKPMVFSGTTENPTEANLDACLALWAEHGCDGVIALGGGSALDLSKAVALLTSHGGRFADYDVKTGGSARIGKVSPQIAIPTAAGTGAEIGRASVMSLHDGRKCVAVSLKMVADTIIADPGLTLSLPPRLTAATGIDALSHGIESFLSPSYNPPADAIALDAVARTARSLRRATEVGSDREARREMMMGALEGGMALQKGLGAAHAMATPLGEAHYHHGTLIGILLPHVVAWNRPFSEDRIARLEQATGDGRPLERWLSDLVGDLGLPQTLSALGVHSADLPSIAVKAAKDHLTLTNPRPTGADDYGTLLLEAM